MNREKISNYLRAVIIFGGILCLSFAVIKLPEVAFHWGFILVLVFAVFVAPRMSIKFPRSSLILSFSDSVIFLTFLLYGGEMAVLVAFIETFANCLYLKKTGTFFRNWMVLFNSAFASLLTTFTYGILFTFTSLINSELNLSFTRNLATVLGLLALSQFFASSFFVAFYQNVSANESIWETLKKECLSSSLTQFTGAALAGIVYKVINYADLAIMIIAATVLAIAYVNYRMMIGEIDEAIGKAEDAEREKRVEAEIYAERISHTLTKVEKANHSLRQSQLALEYAASFDSLTKLANRQQFADILGKLLEEYKQDSSIHFQVMFLDIRRFKDINDSLGHTVGDKVLMIVAKRFLRMLHSTDTVARLGGDEFAIILRDVGTTGKALKIARKIYHNITQPFALGGNRFFISINIGIAPCDTEYETIEEILRDADIAMHYAKEKGTGVAVFTKELRERFLQRVKLEAELRYAIERNELSMHYQPLVSLKDGGLIGFEALLRWHSKELGFISPAQFIPIAEESGLIIPITIWILQETCTQLAHWQKIAPEYAKLIVSVNISGKHLSNDELVDDVEQAIETSGITPESLKLEITESVVMENAEHTIAILTKLKNIGVQLSIDDFGTGYSSLSYLHRLPFDTLKIDRSFVYSVGENGENSEILRTIVLLAKNLKMKIIAEGIETEAQLSLLQFLGCDYGQGYLLAKPQPKDAAEKLLYEKRNLLPFDPSENYDSENKISADDHLPVF
jgi:diguanylate cyclase (GGDEF)-like protein